MFIRTSARKIAKEQASPNNVIEFKQTVAVMKKGERRYASVVFEGSKYRLLKFEPSLRAWDMKRLEGQGPLNIAIPVTLFEEFCLVVSDD